MSPRDFSLLTEGYNEKVKIEHDKELIRLRFARMQAFFSYCSVQWKDAPKNFTQFCKDFLPLPGDEQQQGDNSPKVMTAEKKREIQEMNNKLTMRKLKKK